MGRYDIKVLGNYVIDKVNKVYGEEVISRVLTDTDSFFLMFDKLVEIEIKNGRIKDDIISITTFIDEFDKHVIQKMIKEKIKETHQMLNCYNECINYDREKIGSIIITGKKRYAVNLYNNEGVDLTHAPKITITGLEIKRSDTPSLIRTKLAEVIDILFEDDNDKLIDYINNFKKEHKKSPLDEIAIPKGVNVMGKYANTTKGVPMHVRAAKVHNVLVKKYNLINDYPLINNGDKLKIIPLKTPNNIKSDIIAFKDENFLKKMKLERFIDYDTLFKKTFMSPVSTLTNAIGFHTSKSKSIMNILF